MFKLKLITIARIACLSAIATSSLGAQVRLKAGLWEYASTRGGQTSTHTKCLTAAQADTLNGPPALIRAQLENSFSKKQQCKIAELKVGASSLNSTISCGEMSLTNVMVFHDGETAENTMTTRTQGQEHVATMTMKRLGACPANSK